MNERFKIFYQNAGMIIGDTGLSFFSYLSVSQWFGIALNAIVAFCVAVIGGSVLFVLQKTILPRVIDHINLNWFKRKNNGNN